MRLGVWPGLKALWKGQKMSRIGWKEHEIGESGSDSGSDFLAMWP